MAKIRHIVFNTTDPERLAKFYVDVLGLTIQHRAENGGIQLTDGYMNFSIHTNKIDGKPSGFNHFGFRVDDNEAVAKEFEKHGYRPPGSVRATAISQNIARLIRMVTTWIFQCTDTTASGLTVNSSGSKSKSKPKSKSKSK